jgi:hypothetical protein
MHNVVHRDRTQTEIQKMEATVCKQSVIPTRCLSVGFGQMLSLRPGHIFSTEGVQFLHTFVGDALDGIEPCETCSHEHSDRVEPYLSIDVEATNAGCDVHTVDSFGDAGVCEKFPDDKPASPLVTHPPSENAPSYSIDRLIDGLSKLKALGATVCHVETRDDFSGVMLIRGVRTKPGSVNVKDVAVMGLARLDEG